MFVRHVASGVLAAAVVAFAVVAQATVTVDMVPVGNAGNEADDTGFGAVAYDYQIGKYEVTVSQYTAFLNAVAKTDQYGLYTIDMDTGYGYPLDSTNHYCLCFADWLGLPPTINL